MSENSLPKPIRDEVIGKTTLELNIWEHNGNRERALQMLRERQQRSRNFCFRWQFWRKPEAFNSHRLRPTRDHGRRQIVAKVHLKKIETQRVEGHWQHAGTIYRDNLVKVVVDLPDSAVNRKWMGAFKERWRKRLDQLELWMVSYQVSIE